MSANEHYAIYQKAEKILKENPYDLQAQFIVDLWCASKNLHKKNVILAEQLAEVNSANARLSARVDVLETKASGTQSYEKFMSNLSAKATDSDKAI